MNDAEILAQIKENLKNGYTNPFSFDIVATWLVLRIEELEREIKSDIQSVS